jgi:two-component system response regulator YesN
MFTILVVDDEQNIRQGITRILEDRFPGKVVIRQAANGLEALEMICAIPVDLIIADIKMPLCGGVEMMQKLKSLEMRKSLIILSGFDDYTFVRETLKLGAEDYLLKPVVPEELCALVENCLLKQSLEGHDTESIESLAFFRDNEERRLLEQGYYFKRIVAGKPWNELFPLEGGCNEKKAAVFVAMDSESPGLRDISRHLGNEIATNCQVLCGTERSFFGMVFISRQEYLVEKREKIFHLLDKQCGRFGVSAVEDLRQAPRGWQRAVKELEKQFYDVREEWDADEHYPYEGIKGQFINILCACSVEKLNPLLDRLFGLLRSDKLPVIEARRFLCSLVYQIMETDAGYISIIGKYKFTEKDLVHVIQNESSASKILSAMKDCLDCYIRERLKLREGLRKDRADVGVEDYTIQRIKRFIETNYQRRITLGMISKKLELHPNYLSTLFRQKTGVTYGHYLRYLRIERAKALIKKTNLKLYSVADQVGYKDNAHFYRAFKEETGISPIEYRNQATDCTID